MGSGDGGATARKNPVVHYVACRKLDTILKAPLEMVLAFHVARALPALGLAGTGLLLVDMVRHVARFRGQTLRVRYGLLMGAIVSGHLRPRTLPGAAPATEKAG